MKMHLVNQTTNKLSADTSRGSISMKHADNIDTAINQLTSVVETACEHASDLDLMRMINFMDLYRAYLTEVKLGEVGLASLAIVSEQSATSRDVDLGSTPLVSFEDFIGDSRLLELAAAVASVESGETVSAPAPLRLSANATF